MSRDNVGSGGTATMPVTVFVKATGAMFRGRLAVIGEETVSLFSDAKTTGNGLLVGSGEATVFRKEEVELLAHNWDVEVREEQPVATGEPSRGNGATQALCDPSLSPERRG